MVKAAVKTKPSVPAKIKPASTDLAMPDYMKGDVGKGTEGIGRDDMEQPRLKLMQGLSPELKEYDDLRAGMFFHPMAEHIFDKPFRAVIIFVDRRYILWNPREAGG